MNFVQKLSHFMNELDSTFQLKSLFMQANFHTTFELLIKGRHIFLIGFLIEIPTFPN